MSTDNFYAELPALENLCRIVTNEDNFVPVPNDWQVVITDVIGSTKAIEAGRYKDVNILGACSIIALLNVADGIDLPFIFGGDGASILIPPSLLPRARQVLLSTQKFAQEELALGLRVGIVPVAVVKSAKYDIKVAKSKVSQLYYQAVFNGGGISYAEQLIKDPATSEKYGIKDVQICLHADFSGLVCPWQDIPSKNGEIVSLIVQARAANGEDAGDIYDGVLKQIQNVYRNEDNLNPIVPENLGINLNGQNLSSVAKVQAKSSYWRWPILHLWKNQLSLFLIKLLSKFKIRLGKQDFSQTKNNVVADTDYIKFDDTLRMVLATHPEQRAQLTGYLEQNYQAGKLVYGLHVSDRALMTCLVLEKEGRHIAFVDGADGGYALAAKAMKLRQRAKGNQVISNPLMISIPNP